MSFGKEGLYFIHSCRITKSPKRKMTTNKIKTHKELLKTTCTVFLTTRSAAASVIILNCRLAKVVPRCHFPSTPLDLALFLGAKSEPGVRLHQALADFLFNSNNFVG